MSGSNISKIERVRARHNLALGADLLLDKRAGVFYADVGGERVSANSKNEAIKLIEAALAAITSVMWREVILLRVEEPDEDDKSHRENLMSTYRASCSFQYLRRERAVNPTSPKETIEREHRIEFEERVAQAREYSKQFTNNQADKKKRADAAEKDLRDDRDALARVDPQWSPRDSVTEIEIPYSDEAWIGIERISNALRETQAKLDEFARNATSEKLIALATGDVFGLLASTNPNGATNDRR